MYFPKTPISEFWVQSRNHFFMLGFCWFASGFQCLCNKLYTNFNNKKLFKAGCSENGCCTSTLKKLFKILILLYKRRKSNTNQFKIRQLQEIYISREIDLISSFKPNRYLYNFFYMHLLSIMKPNKSRQEEYDHYDITGYLDPP